MKSNYRHWAHITSILLLLTMSQIPSVAAEATPETAWAEFTSFEYQGRDRDYDHAPPSANEFFNPILAGGYPDPSICRVGTDYYLVNSSFAFYPGIPIFHSKDLVNWVQLGHVLDRPSQLNLDGVAVSSGIFAPAITYHDGLFYVITTGVYAGGNFYVTATNPAGPWSDPVPLPEVKGIDPSIFFDDDGKAYIVHNGAPPEDKPLYDGHRAVWLWELDLKTKKVTGEGKIIVNGGSDLARKPIWIEGPHIWKRNGFCYLSAAEGGTGPAHSQVVFRSRSVWGPYEPCVTNPILTQRDLDRSRPSPITSTGHADLVETPEGDWWAIFLAVRPRDGINIGRETFLLPVKWENDWPVILPPSTPVPQIHPRPKLANAVASNTKTTGSFTWRDDFDTSKLRMEWNFLRTPREHWWSLSTKPGSLLLAPRPVPLNSVNKKDRVANGNPSYLGRRLQHHDFSAQTTLVVNPQTLSSDMGIAALQNNANYVFLGVHTGDDGAREIFLEQQTSKTSNREILTQSRLPTGTRSIDLKIEGTGRQYAFSYRISGQEWVRMPKEINDAFLSSQGGSFVGTYIGPFVRTP